MRDLVVAASGGALTKNHVTVGSANISVKIKVRGGEGEVERGRARMRKGKEWE
jgi:hypothetical protein